MVITVSAEGGSSAKRPRVWLNFFTVVTLLFLGLNGMCWSPTWRIHCRWGMRSWVEHKDEAYIVSKKKLLAAGVAGFVSLESSTSEKPVGTFVPSFGTPRRSPRFDYSVVIIFLRVRSETLSCTGTKWWLRLRLLHVLAGNVFAVYFVDVSKSQTPPSLRTTARNNWVI